MSASAPRARELAARLDPAREALNALLGPAPASREAWAEARRLCLGARDADGRLLLARAANALGAPAEALAAAEGLPGAEAACLEAEARLLMGEPAGAQAALDRAVAADPRDARARLLSAVSRLAAGQPDAALSDLDAASASAPLDGALAAVRALALAQRGEEAAGAAVLDAAVRARPAGWLKALRGTMRRSLGDLAGARADLDAAVAEEPSAWALSQRADVLNRCGFYRDALKDLERAAALAPGSAAPRAQAANVYFDQAFYPEALAEMDRAVALAPADAGLRARRARFYTVLGRLAEAEDDLARAFAAEPDDAQIRYERLLVAALRGRLAEAARGADSVPPPFDDALRGLAAFRGGRRRKAREFFRRGAGRASGPFAEKLRFYAEVAAVLGDRGRARKPPRSAPHFYLCGIGIRHPYQITVEILRALDSCAVIYNNVGDPQIADFLGLFDAEVRAVDRRFGEPAMGRVERILSGVRRRGRPTGFVTRIHPFIYRRIANDLAQRCEERRIRYRAFGAVSLTESAWGLGDELSPVPPAGAPFAGRVFDLVWLVAHADQLEPRHALVVYCIANTEHRLSLCALLSRRYPAEHPAFVLAGSGDKEQEIRPLTVGALAEVLPKFDMGAVLYVPALGRNR
jgi:tetratricopeptide (TPR) repeat protein